ncbi:Protein kinase domain-containing protein [Mycena sanguinolenta]|uniref:Carbonic anhydrase n=1 Tax=Mycena sanguinolenta TaxID=230812 RepID=A0A8H6YYW3_9AGAR|nr:Protein kinase domain-containing protein [Mycena sanguinolenta]
MNPEILRANEKYVDNYTRPDWSEFTNLVIITCCDPRVDPYGQLGLKNGQAIIIRNAGGSAVDALRSIVVPQYLLPDNNCEIAVMHHTDCGLSKVTTDQIRELVKSGNPGRDDIAAMVDNMEFHHIQDIEESVKNDVRYLAEHPLILKGTKLSGWVQDTETGKISKVVEAMALS